VIGAIALLASIVTGIARSALTRRIDWGGRSEVFVVPCWTILAIDGSNGCEHSGRHA
jgi:hypothetical protein